MLWDLTCIRRPWRHQLCRDREQVVGDGKGLPCLVGSELPLSSMKDSGHGHWGWWHSSVKVSDTPDLRT